MLVEVLTLRRGGRRRPVTELQEAIPARGHLRVSKAPARHLDAQWERSALLLPSPQSVEPLLELHRVRIVSWDPRGLVLAGVEETWRRKECQCWRQAWWVRFPQLEGSAIDSVVAQLQMQLETLFERLEALRP
jgi:hypothetical protein